MLTKLAAAGLTVFTIPDAQQVTGDEPGLAGLLHRLATKHWLQRLERGKYRLIPLEAGPEAQWAEHEFLIAAALVQPYYLAYGTALTYYGYSERPPHPIWIATTRRKRPLTIEGITYRFVTLAPAKFFGITTIDLLGHAVRLAEREKAIVDGFDHPEYCGGVLEPAKGLWFGRDELDLNRLVTYAERLGNGAALRRLGFWLEQLALGDATLFTRRDRSYARLDPTSPADGPRSARWRLIVNVPGCQLLEWQKH
jgi:predicted transcriptional regulator of viral defense system